MKKRTRTVAGYIYFNITMVKGRKKIKDLGGYLSRWYYNPSRPAAYTSASKLFQEIKREGNPHKISFNEVKTGPENKMP